MSSFEQDAGAPGRSNIGQWAAGALRSLATLALSALLVWFAVFAVNETGLLQRPAPAEPHSPAAGSPFAQVAYG